MRITIICVGKLKESYLRDACGEYLKRLSKHTAITVIEVADEKIPNNPNSSETDIVKQKEGEKILRYIGEKHKAYIISLAIGGKQMSSEIFSEFLSSLSSKGFHEIVFIIGGASGLSPSVINISHMLLSFSLLTFPHQLIRVILLEQIYRCMKISKNEPYHL